MLHSESLPVYQSGLKRVTYTAEPENQKFPCGSRVRITDGCISHPGLEATVEHVYAHAYGGGDVKSYSLDIDGHGSVAWYQEGQLTAIS